MTIRPVLNEVLAVTLDDGSALEAPVTEIQDNRIVVGHANEYVFDAVEDYLADGVWFRVDETTGESFTFAQISPEDPT